MMCIAEKLDVQWYSTTPADTHIYSFSELKWLAGYMHTVINITLLRSSPYMS